MEPSIRRTYRLLAYRTTLSSADEGFDVDRTGANGIEIVGHRIKFAVERNLTKHPNSADVEITNLSEHTRATMEKLPLRVQLDAGYDDVNRLLFVGDAIFTMSKQDGEDWTTLLQLGDGARLYANAFISRNYGKPTRARDIIRDVMRSVGQELPKNLLADAKLDQQIAQSTVLHGPFRDEFTRLLALYGYSWSSQNGVIQVLRDDELRADQAWLINEASGMIGSPEFGSPPKNGKPPHMTVNHLLYPELLPGHKVKLDAKAKKGIYKIIRVRHTGDTHRTDWHTEMEIKPL